MSDTSSISRQFGHHLQSAANSAVSSTVGATALQSAAASTAAASNELSGNMNQFLQLLTTQLQNQDPLNPMDSSTFTQQLVEYSQVEQQINTNTRNSTR